MHMHTLHRSHQRPFKFLRSFSLLFSSCDILLVFMRVVLVLLGKKFRRGRHNETTEMNSYQSIFHTNTFAADTLSNCNSDSKQTNEKIIIYLNVRLTHSHSMAVSVTLPIKSIREKNRRWMAGKHIFKFKCAHTLSCVRVRAKVMWKLCYFNHFFLLLRMHALFSRLVQWAQCEQKWDETNTMWNG